MTKTELDTLIAEERRRYAREWREKNREHLREYNKRYRAKNKDRLKQREREMWERKALKRLENEKTATTV
ncbi:hypothetical protein [Ruminococcus sp.]|uniref:hypothetical protein n=1 Tax=Ruminococcus sp. TaxID=41978 RepID=UPI00386B10D9